MLWLSVLGSNHPSVATDCRAARCDW